MSDLRKIDVLWDDNPIDVTQEANFIWSIANKLRGVYMPDKYGDVVIPMTVLRRFECTFTSRKKIHFLTKSAETSNIQHIEFSK